MSGPGFFSYGGITSADVFRMVSALQELYQKLSKIAAVKGGNDYADGLQSLRECCDKVKETLSPNSEFQHTKLEGFGPEQIDQQREKPEFRF